MTLFISYDNFSAWLHANEGYYKRRILILLLVSMSNSIVMLGAQFLQQSEFPVQDVQYFCCI